MNSRIADLQCKEVVNVCDGSRMGYVNDVAVDIYTGRLVAIIVPGPWCFSNVFSRGEEYVIPWDCIEKIGGDIILVRYEKPPQPKSKHHEHRRKLFM